ncbi:hypothetical protein RQP46_009458 [Phenoliferia psychrophenolica]
MSFATPAFETPTGLDPRVIKFIVDFYEAADDPLADYISFFEPNGRMVIGGGQTLEGHAAILARRQHVATAKNITTRLHQTQKVYWADEGYRDILLFGTLEFGLADGTQSPKFEWAARMLFGNSEELRMQEYKVWMDSASLTAVLSPKQ